MAQAVILFAIATLVISMLVASGALIIEAVLNAYYSRQLKKAFREYTECRLEASMRGIDNDSEI